MQFNCWKCGAAIELPSGGRVGKRDACPKCAADLHCCRQCRFYDPGKHNECSETQAEWVRYKEDNNYCDYFQPNPTLMARGERGGSPSENARKKFDSLFKV